MLELSLFEKNVLLRDNNVREQEKTLQQIRTNVNKQNINGINGNVNSFFFVFLSFVFCSQDTYIASSYLLDPVLYQHNPRGTSIDIGHIVS